MDLNFRDLSVFWSCIQCNWPILFVLGIEELESWILKVRSWQPWSGANTTNSTLNGITKFPRKKERALLAAVVACSTTEPIDNFWVDRPDFDRTFSISLPHPVFFASPPETPTPDNAGLFGLCLLARFVACTCLDNLWQELDSCYDICETKNHRKEKEV